MLVHTPRPHSMLSFPCAFVHVIHKFVASTHGKTITSKYLEGLFSLKSWGLGGGDNSIGAVTPPPLEAEFQLALTLPPTLIFARPPPIFFPIPYPP